MSEFTVLLVDDEIEFVSSLAERLKLRKIDAKTAISGEDAFKVISQKRPDVVVLDLKMPGLDGLEVLKHIKIMDTSIQVILLTGHGSTREGIDGMKLGAFNFLMKPIDIDELIANIKKAVASRI
jgi:DNA-binding NtrC family response regulator